MSAGVRCEQDRAALAAVLDNLAVGASTADVRVCVLGAIDALLADPDLVACVLIGARPDFPAGSYLAQSGAIIPAPTATGGFGWTWNEASTYTGPGVWYYIYPDGRPPERDAGVRAFIVSESWRKGIVWRIISTADLISCTLGAIASESAQVVLEAVVLTAGLVDLARMNGFAFPPWEGGPVWSAARAVRVRADRILQLAAESGPARHRADGLG
jgi:hypothetical protein